MLNITLTPDAADFHGITNSASLGSISGVPGRVLAFDDGASDEGVRFKVPTLGYEGGNIRLSINWYADNATSGVVRCKASVMAVTPNSDNVNIESESYATAQEKNDTHTQSQAQAPYVCVMGLGTTTYLDGLAENDWMYLKFERESSDTGNDTMSNDMLVTFISLTEISCALTS